MTPAIRQLLAAIDRTRASISKLEATLEPDTCPCCVGAALGGTHSAHGRARLGDKRAHAVVGAYDWYARVVREHHAIDPWYSRANIRAAIEESAPRLLTDAERWHAWFATWGRIGSEFNVAHWRAVFGPPGTARGW